MSWRMPSETARQTRVWMAFPPAGRALGDTIESADEARRAWSTVAHAVSNFEPVTMLVDPVDLDTAKRYLSCAIEIVPAPLDDAWMRDIGPTFVISEDHRLGAVNWRFNGWGQQSWARWSNDRHIATRVAELAGAECIDAGLVNEGGGIQVDGQGSVLLTETVQLDPYRNPRIGRAKVEAEMARTIGSRHAIWLKRGLYRDTKRFGTRGHVDIVATIPSPGLVLVHDQQDASHPDHAVSREIIATLDAAHTVDGKPWTLRRLPAPRALRDAEDFVDYSYVNHLVVNDGVIACTYDDPADDDALAILAEAYPGRRVVGVDARPIFARGGGVHCITQHQPALAKAAG